MTKARPIQHKPLGQTLDWTTAAPSNNLSLGENEVHIWYVPLDLNSLEEQDAIKCLNSHQLDKYQRRRSSSTRINYLAGRYYLTKLLCAYTHQPLNHISLSYSRLKKPFLEPNPKNICFNFSDTKGKKNGVGIFALTLDREVGVDIEHFNRNNNFTRIMERKLTEKEQTWVNGSRNRIDPKKFLAIWTRKEAYGKATGQGINYKMNRLSLLSSEKNEQHQMSFKGLDELQSDYQLHQIAIGSSHIACVVYEGKRPLEVKAFTIDPKLVSDE